MIRNILILFSACVNIGMILSLAFYLAGCSADLKASEIETNVKVDNPFNASGATARV